MISKLQRLGVMHAEQPRSYIWDENNKVSYDISSDAFATNHTELINCPKATCFDGAEACQCSYKPGVIDVAAKWHELLELTAQERMGNFHGREIHWLIRYWNLFALAVLLYPQGMGNSIFKWLFHKNLGLLMNIWIIAKIQNFQWNIIKFIEPVCIKNPANPNPIYWDVISKYIPGWNCLEYHLRLEFDQSCILSLLMIINILIIRNRRKKSTNLRQSPYEEITGKDLDGNRINYFSKESDDENDNVEERGRRQIERSTHFVRELPVAQRCADINYAFYRYFFFYTAMVGFLLYGTISAFFQQIKETPGKDLTMDPNPFGVTRWSWMYSMHAESDRFRLKTLR